MKTETKTEQSKSKAVLAYEREQAKKIANRLSRVSNVPSPKQMKAELDKYVIGQEEAKKILSVAVYNHYIRVRSKLEHTDDGKFGNVVIEKSNIMLLGNTGTGKTYMLKILANLLNVPFYIADATKLTASGYVGNDVENIISGVLAAADDDVEIAQMGMVAIDEGDKIARKGDNPSITRDVSGECVQQGLLKIVEGDVVSVPPLGGRLNPMMNNTKVDTTDILFVMMGAFEGLESIIRSRMKTSAIGFNATAEEHRLTDKGNLLDYATAQDLVKFGMIPELIGRFPLLTATKPLSTDDLKRIFCEPVNSIKLQYEKLFSLDNTKLVFDERAIEHIADIAFKTGTGARGLRRIVEKVLIDLMFEFGGTKNETLTVTSQMVRSIMKTKTKTIA